MLKEYVVVPDTLLVKTKELALHFAASHAYVGSLPPKATKRASASKNSAVPKRRAR